MQLYIYYNIYEYVNESVIDTENMEREEMRALYFLITLYITIVRSIADSASKVILDSSIYINCD